MILTLNGYPPEVMWVVQLVGTYLALWVMLRCFGVAGAFVFMVIAIIAANIEVLKVVQFAFFTHPIALGTVFYSAAFLATDILVEYCGPGMARRGILMGFAGSLLMLFCMTLSLGFRPLTAAQALQAHIWHAGEIQSSLFNLFSPTPVLLFASLTSYLISQFTDLSLFSWIKGITGQRGLWLRSNVSTVFAALLDSFIFNLLAWRLLTAHPVSWHTLFYTYVLPTYSIRIVIAVLGTPCIYLARYAFAPSVGTKQTQVAQN